MALPAILLKAKKAVTAAQTAKSVKDSGAGEEVAKTAMSLSKKVTLIAAITTAPFFFFIIFVVVAVGHPERIYTMYGAVGGDSSGTSSSCGGTIDSYIEWAKNTADDDTHGYNMDVSLRLGNPDYDCSSFVYYALKEGAGISTDKIGTSPFGTGIMDTPMEAAGFKKHEFSGKESDLQVGDILWVHNGSKHHTEIYIGEGKTIGAHSNYDGVAGDSSGKEIAAVDGNWSKYSHYYRLTSGSSDGTTCDDKISGEGKILIIAGHSYVDCKGGRSRAASGYLEPEETRKLAKKVQSDLKELGVESDIANALVAGESDKMNATFVMNDAYKKSCWNDTKYANFDKYDWGSYKYVIEFHFNAVKEGTSPTASGPCLMKFNKDASYVSKADDDVVEAITTYTKKESKGWCATNISNTKNQTYFHKKNVPMTYVEVEFFDNKKAMNKYSKHIDKIAKGIAKAIKKHYG